jgi:hypothetical protein
MKRIGFVGLLLGTVAAFSGAQAQQRVEVAPSGPARAYQFMTLTATEGAPGYLSFSPEFNGQKIIKLEDVYTNQQYNDKVRLALQANEAKVMRLLEETTAAGWELVHVSSQSIRETTGRDMLQTRYLLRRAK